MTVEDKSISCSFCGKGRHEVHNMIEGPIFNGSLLYICDECVKFSYDVLNQDSEVKVTKKKKEKLPTPEEIKSYLDEYIVGQDKAKVAISVAVYNHFKRINNRDKDIEIDKSNLLMVGASGSGKTLTVKTISKLYDIPYVIADATTITEAGYVGEDVENLVKRLYENSGENLEKAQNGIIFIDEIDKKSRKSESSTVSRDVSGEGVQQALLKMIEGTILEFEDSQGNEVQFDTKNVLFVCSGAFVGLDELIRKNRSKTSIGIGAQLNVKSSFSDTVSGVIPEDFVKFGLIPEFVGRCPVTVVFDDLTVEMLVRILKEPKNSLVSQFKSLFKYEGVTLEFDDKYLQNVAEECLRQKVGARGLRSILEKDLQAVQFVLPRLAKEGVSTVAIDARGSVKYIYKTKRSTKRVNND